MKESRAAASALGLTTAASSSAFVRASRAARAAARTHVSPTLVLCAAGHTKATSKSSNRKSTLIMRFVYRSHIRRRFCGADFCALLCKFIFIEKEQRRTTNSRNGALVSLAFLVEYFLGR